MNTGATNTGVITQPTTTLYLSPHSDDIAYSLAGRILAGCEITTSQVLVTVFTQSKYAPFAAQDLDIEAITKLRLAEETEFCRNLNVASELLTLSEAPLRGYLTTDDLFVSVEQAKLDPILPLLTTQFRALLDKYRPGKVYAPLGIGGHVDHLLTRFAAEAVCDGVCPVLFYEDLPYIGELTDDERQQALAATTQGKRSELTPTDIWFQTKLRLLHGYTSQVGENNLQSVISYTHLIGGERVWI
jgi:LmbE family N-acetylglucosaminyl deacetylase